MQTLKIVFLSNFRKIVRHPVLMKNVFILHCVEMKKKFGPDIISHKKQGQSLLHKTKMSRKNFGSDSGFTSTKKAI